MYFLDTNTCLYYLNGRYDEIKRRILECSPSEIKIASVVKAELLLGAYKSTKRDSTLERLEAFLAPFEVVPFDDPACSHYALLRYQTEQRGRVVGPNDLFIAAIVHFHQGILVTNNTREFSVIEDLLLENWAV